MAKWMTCLVAIAVTMLCGCAIRDGGLAASGNGTSDAGVLRVGVTPNYPPIIFEQAGRITGLEVELAKRVAGALGKTVEFVERDWDDLIPALEAGKIDIIMSGMSITKARQHRVLLTNPYMVISQMALVQRSDARQYRSPWALIMHRGKVGVVEATTGAYLADSRIADAKIVQFSNSERAVKALIKKKIDVFIHDAPHIMWLESRHESDSLVAVPHALTQEFLAWAMRKDDRPTVDRINAMLQVWYDDGSLSRTVANWVPGY
jgi:ABC-type amino acid transport substrate-binding protein